MKSALIFPLTLALGLSVSDVFAATADFENLVLAPESSYPQDTTVNFSSGGAEFVTDVFSGWFYSNTTDVTTAGFTNDASAYSLPGGGGNNGSSNYGVAFDPSSFGGNKPRIEFAGLVAPGSVFVTNNTYAALSMKLGDLFAKKFGGLSGDDADFLSLDIIGLNGLVETGRVSFFLADFRFADNTQDYIVDSWREVALGSLGVIDALEFQLTSTDNGGFGINTPAYFAIDDLNFAPIPLPPAFVLMLSALGLLRLRKRPV